MKNKRLIVVFISLFLVACADKERYEKAVLEDVEKEQDVKDYNIEPSYMAKCVIDTTYHKMPGFFPFHPERLEAYRNYTKMLTMSKSSDPQKTLEELRKDFGSPQALAKAHSVYTESMMDCYSAITQEGDKDSQDILPKQNTKG